MSRQLAVPRRSLLSASCDIRIGLGVQSQPVNPTRQQIRGVKTIDFAGEKEEVYGNESSQGVELSAT